MTITMTNKELISTISDFLQNYPFDDYEVDVVDLLENFVDYVENLVDLDNTFFNLTDEQRRIAIRHFENYLSNQAARSELCDILEELVSEYGFDAVHTTLTENF